MLNPEKLRKAREAAGMTQARAAKAIGVTPGRVSQYECGVNDNPELRRLQQFARVYGVTIADLVDDREEP